MVVQSSGIIIPPKEDQKLGWYALAVDSEIERYYRNRYELGLRSTWYPAMNGCHMTLIAGEKDDRLVARYELEPYFHTEFHFYYTHQVCSNGRAFWLPALSPDLDLLRTRLGLQPRLLYHVTLGNIKNDNKNFQ